MYTRSMRRENMAAQSIGSLAEHPAEPSAYSYAFRSAGPLPQLPTEPSASSHAFPEVSGNPVPPSGSPEHEALEGLLHVNLPASLGQQQQVEQGELETVVILDAEEAPRGPGRRTKEGEIKRNESDAGADDVRDVLDWVLTINAPRGRMLKRLQRKGLQKMKFMFFEVFQVCIK